MTICACGIDVIVTDLDSLRGSDPFWSGLWRICYRWFGNSSGNGWLPNPLGEQAVGLRTWLKIANFKANHRKSLVVYQVVERHYPAFVEHLVEAGKQLPAHVRQAGSRVPAPSVRHLPRRAFARIFPAYGRKAARLRAGE